MCEGYEIWLVLFLIINAINKYHSTDYIEWGLYRTIVSFRTWRLTVQGSTSTARKAEGQRSLEICITCSNIKRPLVWSDNVTVRRKIRASRRLSHRFGLLLLLVPLVLSSSLTFFSPGPLVSLSAPVRHFFLLSSISAVFSFFLVRVFLSFSLSVSRIVAASKGCRAQKYLRTWVTWKSIHGELLNLRVTFSCAFFTFPVSRAKQAWKKRKKRMVEENKAENDENEKGNGRINAIIWIKSF